jgi:MoaA/NifB/PqqE/SkfB family radical SAM enzyme
VERKVALGAATNIEIDVMNTKRAEDFEIVSQDDQARDLIQDWVTFCQSLERKYGVAPRSHDLEGIRAERYLDQDENSGRYTLLEGVQLIWKQCHSWGNVLGSQGEGTDQETYCPAPYEQFVIQWNGDAVNCCIDYEGKTKVANVFKDSLESVWTGAVLTQRKRDMLGGRLLDVCAKCLGVK